MPDPTQPRADWPEEGPPIERPRVLVCDAGELEDVYRLLCGLDPSPLRLSPEHFAELRPWERPSRLLITTVRVALTIGLPPPDPLRPFVSVAVADDDARTPGTSALRQGFRYVVRRPVHPEALRLLLRQVLWQGHDHRVASRFPFGARIGWRSGLRRGRATLLEISAHGCRLLCGAPFRVGQSLRLRIPAALIGSGDLRLRGRIVRRGAPRQADGPGERQVAVRFERLSQRHFAHLDALLAERASGPAVMEGAAAAPPRVPPGRSGPRGPLRLGSRGDAAEPAAAPGDAGSPRLERRRRRRGVWHHELLALDPGSDRVRHTLLGSDLSVGGVRVEPNPLLRIGDRLRLALYDGSEAEPLVLAARVAHDQGRRGVGLVFIDPSGADRERLERMVDALPPLSSLAPDGDKPQGMVLGEIVSLDGEAEASGRVDQEQGEPEDHEATPGHHDEEA